MEYIPVKCFNKFVQSAVKARREDDENPISSVVAETTKMLANNPYVYQIMHRRRHTVTIYLSGEKTHGAINTKLFKRLDHIINQLYEVELAKAEIELREPIIVGFFILQYAKLRMLELYCNFFGRFCDFNNFEELELDTDSLYLRWITLPLNKLLTVYLCSSISALDHLPQTLFQTFQMTRLRLSTHSRATHRENIGK